MCEGIIKPKYAKSEQPVVAYSQQPGKETKEEEETKRRGIRRRGLGRKRVKGEEFKEDNLFRKMVH